MNIKRCIPWDQKKPLVYVSNDESITSIYELMQKHSINHIGVKKDNHFIGLIDQATILHTVMKYPRNFDSLEAKDIVKKDLPILNKSSSLDDLIEGMQSRGVNALPYYEKGECKTLITRSDLVLILKDVLYEHQSLFENVEAKGELFMANPLVQKIMATLDDLGI